MKTDYFSKYYNEARTDYSVGRKFKVSRGSGLDSDKEVTVIKWFDWEKADDGTYSAPDRKQQVAIQYADGKRGFMWKSRLLSV